MPDKEKLIKGLECCTKGNACISDCPYFKEVPMADGKCITALQADALALLKEQEKKRITLHKNHTITLRRNDKFSMRELYEAICETLLDEGELFIERTDNHEKVDFLFYVAEGR